MATLFVGGGAMWMWHSKPPPHRRGGWGPGSGNSQLRGGQQSSGKPRQSYLVCPCGNWTWQHRAGATCIKCNKPWGSSSQQGGDKHQPPATLPQHQEAPLRPAPARTIDDLNPKELAKVLEIDKLLDDLGLGHLPKDLRARAMPPPAAAAAKSKSYDECLQDLNRAKGKEERATKTEQKAAAEAERLRLL